MERQGEVEVDETSVGTYLHYSPTLFVIYNIIMYIVYI
nr:MAG TPA: hypothetical protein [Caudoviricetes sp.]